MTTYFDKVLERDLPASIAAGWTDTGVRAWIPSLFEYSALIEWTGAGEPPAAEKSL